MNKVILSTAYYLETVDTFYRDWLNSHNISFNYDTEKNTFTFVISDTDFEYIKTLTSCDFGMIESVIKIDNEPENYDCYALQIWVDGFDSNTSTIAICQTKEEAEEYLLKNGLSAKIVGQNFGVSYNNCWD